MVMMVVIMMIPSSEKGKQLLFFASIFHFWVKSLISKNDIESLLCHRFVKKSTTASKKRIQRADAVFNAKPESPIQICRIFRFVVLINMA